MIKGHILGNPSELETFTAHVQSLQSEVKYKKKVIRVEFVRAKPAATMLKCSEWMLEYPCELWDIFSCFITLKSVKWLTFNKIYMFLNPKNIYI